MPVYEYECQKCHKRFSDIRPIKECKEGSPCFCGGEGKRVMSPCTWKAFVGSFSYDRINNYPPGMSATDNIATEDW